MRSCSCSMAGIQSLMGCCAPCIPFLGLWGQNLVRKMYNFSPAMGSCVYGWQVSELSGTQGLQKEKILQTVAAYAIGASLQWWARVRWPWVLNLLCKTDLQGNGLLHFFFFNSFFFLISLWRILDSAIKIILIYLKYFWRGNLFL